MGAHEPRTNPYRVYDQSGEDAGPPADRLRATCVSLTGFERGVLGRIVRRGTLAGTFSGPEEGADDVRYRAVTDERTLSATDDRRTAFDRVGDARVGELVVETAGVDCRLRRDDRPADAVAPRLTVEAAAEAVLGGHVDAVESRLRAFRDLVALCATTADPELGYAAAVDEDDSFPFPPPEALEFGTPGAYRWLTVLSTAMADRVGRDRIEGAPLHRIRELDDGGLLLVLAPDPTEVEERRPAVEAALGAV